ncbi:MAG: HAD family hydrolase [Blautia massiliensis (ex Durand et al. 2017)]|nr:MAG: hypothetical protein DBX91_14465 [Subdoligranulum variabile]
MNDITKKILRRAAAYRAVALDVFDTLIKRDVGRPTDLFLLGGETFAKARVAAETQARAESGREVTLAEIYARPGLRGCDPADECAWELAAAVPNRPVLEAVRALHAQGKKLYYISDMYLPSEQIAAMLQHCGYDMLDGGFVSSAYGVQKRSGALFRRFLHDTGLKASEVLFIGDDWRADVAGAALAGVRAWHLPVESAGREEPQPQARALAAFCGNRLGGQPVTAESIGFSVLGPLMVAFCRWLHDSAPRRAGGRLFFLARDMYLMRAAYQVLYPEEATRYLQVSRRSLCPALLEKRMLPQLLAALPRQRLTGAEIAAYCGAACPKESAEQIFDLKAEPADGSVLDFLGRLQPAQDGALALEYLRQEGLRTGDCLVDIGSGGTTQMLLEALCQIKLQGLQLSGDGRLPGRFPDGRAQVCLAIPEKQKATYWAGQPMLERLLSEDVGATLGYIKTQGTVRAKQQQQVPEPCISALQRGAMAFVTAWKGSVLADVLIPPPLAIQPFLRMAARPRKAELEILGDLTVEDGGIYPLAAAGSWAGYLRSPRQAARDFSQARWKVGFLKRLLPLPLPYDRLYAAAKRNDKG